MAVDKEKVHAKVKEWDEETALTVAEALEQDERIKARKEKAAKEKADADAVENAKKRKSSWFLFD